MKFSKALIVLIFVAAALVRLVDVLRPIDKPSWRECDLGSISRNFVNEGFNPFYPQVDWRGNSPGYAEMEFTLYPALIAGSYEIFGVHDFIGRIWAFLFSLGALFFFYKLARFYLDEIFAALALAFMAFNPLVVEISTSIQPEGLMIFAYIAAIYFFLRWTDDKEGGAGAKFFWPAVAFTALALLAKATAAHIGLFFAALLLQKYGVSVIRQTRVWLFGLLTVAPAALWYVHAKTLWKVYGNSLGVSNEYHWIGPDFFTNPYFIEGILRTEFFKVWMIGGLVVAVFAIWRGGGEKLIRHTFLWFLGIFAIYLAAARTTADDWASYYHIFSVAPAALLVGFGLQKVWAYAREPNLGRGPLQMIGRTAVVALIALSAAGALTYEAVRVRADIMERHLTDKSFACAREIKPALAKPGLILASGGNCADKDGYALAYNASFMFYWLDRKGFNICVEDQTVEKVRQFAGRGAVYFVAQKSHMKDAPHSETAFETGLRNNFPLVSECDEVLVFDIGDK
jgi:Dolichyl-phosphate-mannose-protein mannosyltransferase